MAFMIDPRIAASSHAVAQLALCEVRLQDDTRFPWLVLVPRRPGLVELIDLDAALRPVLLDEVMAAGVAVRALGRRAGWREVKLNHGQLGNIVSQLHVHVVGRHEGDAAWPGPVWGVGETVRYAAEALAETVAVARAALA